MKQAITQSFDREIFHVNYKETKKWILNKHYAKRMPSISFSFGLYINKKLEGIITFGSPPSQSLCVGICGKEYKNNVLELNRLVINSNVPKNSASFLVSNSIKILPEKYKIIVSYADTSVGHIGYIYQATNFIYTGLSDKRTEWRIKGKNLHSKTICETYSLLERKNNKKFEIINRPRKHRYIFFRGDKKERLNLKKKLKYKIEKYPKGITKKYNSPDISIKQEVLTL